MLTTHAVCDIIHAYGGDILISENIRTLRKELNLTQTEFAKRIYVSRDVISNVELKRVEPSELIINAICTEFGANEKWLRTGEGEMFSAKSTEDKLIDAFGKLVNQSDNSFAKQLIAALAELTPEQWKTIEAFAWNVVDSQKEAEKEKDGK